MHRHQRILGPIVLGLICLGLGPAVFADTVVTNSGQTYHGHVISQGDGKIVFQVDMYGAKFKKTFEESEVTLTRSDTEGVGTAEPADKAEAEDALTRPKAPPVKAYEGPTYYRVPLEGTIGKTFTASLLEAALADALSRKPDVVILEIDSPGGIISEVPKIGAVLQRYRGKLRLVVWTKDALSAAAIASLAVDEIYVKPLGRIGAATAWQAGEDGMPTAIAEKFQSVWRATARSMADLGGHDPLLAEAMIDARVELYLAEVDGATVLRQGTGTRQVTRSGRLLTMTAGEAVDIGLAKGKVATLDALGEALGFEEWKECEGLGVALADWQQKRLAEAEEAFAAAFEDFKKNLDSAMANDPARADYVVHQGGRFTGPSKQKWRRLAGACTRFLGKAEKNLEEATKLAEEYPGLLSDPEMLRQELEKVSSLRKRVFAEMNREGLRP